MNDEDKRKAIVTFLMECHRCDWELDNEDIYHVLNLDFDWVRKQYMLEEVNINNIL